MPWDDFNLGAHKSSQSDHDFRVDIMLEEKNQKKKKNTIEKKGTIGNKHRESNHIMALQLIQHRDQEAPWCFYIMKTLLIQTVQRHFDFTK